MSEKLTPNQVLDMADEEIKNAVNSIFKKEQEVNFIQTLSKDKVDEICKDIKKIVINGARLEA